MFTRILRNDGQLVAQFVQAELRDVDPIDLEQNRAKFS
jgi:hypothetical protein